MDISQEERQLASHMLNSGNKNPSIMGDPDVSFFTNKYGLRIKTLKWLVKAPIGAVVLVHSLNSHCRFDYLKHNATILNNNKAVLNDEDNYYVHKNSWIEELNKNGYSVYGLDLQGHGESESLNNIKTHINKFDDFADDILQYLNIIHDSIVNEFDKSQENDKDGDTNKIKPRKRCTKCDIILNDESGMCCVDDEEAITKGLRSQDPGKNQYKRPDYNIDAYKTPIPIYLVGLSMGGNIVLRILELMSQQKYNFYNRLNIKGVCSLSGMISINQLKKKPSWKYFYIPTVGLASYLFPKSRFMPSLPCESFPFLNDLYSYDKIFYHKPITNKFAYELLEAADNLNKDIIKITGDVSILFIHSINDQKCCYKDAQDFYNNLKSSNKEFYSLEDMEHIITIEPGNDRVVKKIIDWISNIEKESKGEKKTKKKAKKKLRSTIEKQAAPNQSCTSTDPSASIDYSKDKATQGEAKLDQDAQDQIILDEGIEYDGTLNKGVEDDGTLNKGVEDDGTLDEGIEDDGTLDEGIEDDGTLYEGIEYNGTLNKGVEDDGTLDEGVEDDGTLDEGIEYNGTLNKGVEDDGTLDEGIEYNGTLNKGVEDDGTLDEGIEYNGTLNKGVEDDGTLDEGIEYNGTLNKGVEDDGTLDEGIEYNGTLNKGVEDDGTLDEGIEYNGTLNKGVEDDGTLDEGIEDDGALNKAQLGEVA
ncbi:lysophospholipase, putative [Plasmodium berghei]|uniref:Lysophospholipase, putative n=1 Tax=Plasmodium berghei TaxID=5821 RepID=A0A113SA06_PLABE|nr:lysophospholipase, putative [Plasmodium berghei]